MVLWMICTSSALCPAAPRVEMEMAPPLQFWKRLLLMVVELADAPAVDEESEMHDDPAFTPLLKLFNVMVVELALALARMIAVPVMLLKLFPRMTVLLMMVEPMNLIRLMELKVLLAMTLLLTS